MRSDWSVFILTAGCVSAWVILARTVGVWMTNASWKIWRGSHSGREVPSYLKRDAPLAFLLFPVNYFEDKIGRLYFSSSPPIVRYIQRHVDGSPRAKKQYYARAPWLSPARMLYCLSMAFVLILPTLIARSYERWRERRYDSL